MSSPLEYNFLITRISETQDTQDNVNILSKKVSIIFSYAKYIFLADLLRGIIRAMRLSHFRMKKLKFRGCCLHVIS